ncbi:MAG: FAD-dependent oxidoreductase, partial [Deltaproteobacteria bacterium]
MSDTMYDVIIIGGGPAGLNAGIYAKRAAMNTVLIEKGIAGGQIVNSDEVENYLGFEHITGAELSMKFSQHAQSYGLEILSREAVGIVPG